MESVEYYQLLDTIYKHLICAEITANTLLRIGYTADIAAVKQKIVGLEMDIKIMYP